MIGRGFAYYRDNSIADLELVASKLRDSKRKEIIKHPFKRAEFRINEIKVGKITKVEPNDGDKSYLPVLFRAAKAENMNDASLNKEETDISVFAKKVETPYFFFSYIFDDLIIFSKFTDVKRIFGPYLAQKMGLDIVTPGYNTEGIYLDYFSKNQVGGAGFYNRAGIAQSGAVYYNMSNLGKKDIIVTEVQKADKFMVRLILDINGEQTSANVYETGSIVLNQNWTSMGEYYSQYKVLKDLLKPYEK